ncbi:porin [Hydrogenophaga sp.]|uniref:porin n=1 Tax=Hydrogenophaga sp. TaxID=1904254 RepID=UPI0025C6A188|nr:porin [Hydrogenophaga sp.]
MKKSLMALAVLATTGAALAQSNVTLYGRIDSSIGSNKVNGVSTNQLFSGNLTTSRYGFRGTEDLGGGLKANFVLENGFNSDDGTLGSANTAFNRQSWVGLSGGFGALKLGKTDSVFKDVYDLGNSNNLYDSEFTPVKIAYAGVSNFSSRPNNQIRYDTPSLAGFSAGVSVSFDETASVNNDLTALSLRYRAGKLDVGVGYQDQKNAVAASDREYTVLAAAYNFGVVRVSGQVHNAKQGNGVKDSDYAFGVAVPIGSFDVSAGYAASTTKTNGIETADGSAFAFGATYSLSKRTRLYGGYLTGKVKNTSTGATTTDRTLYSMGVRHDF